MNTFYVPDNPEEVMGSGLSLDSQASCMQRQIKRLPLGMASSAVASFLSGGRMPALRWRTMPLSDVCSQLDLILHPNESENNDKFAHRVRPKRNHTLYNTVHIAIKLSRFSISMHCLI